MSKTNHFPIVPHCSVKPSIPSTTRGNTPMKKRIFTLIELLIVIAIIAILASMLLPALNKARSRAKNASCQARLKQVAAAAIGYTGDNGDFFPPVSNGIYGESNDPFWKYLFAGNTLATSESTRRAIRKTARSITFTAPIRSRLCNVRPARSPTPSPAAPSRPFPR